MRVRRKAKKMKSSEGEGDSNEGVEWMEEDAAAAAAATTSTTATADEAEEEFEYSDEEEQEDTDEVDWEDVAETPRSSAATQPAAHGPAAIEPHHQSDHAEAAAVAVEDASSSGDDAGGDGDDDGDETYEEPDEEAVDDSDDDDESDGDDEQVLMDLQKVNWEQVNQVLQQEAQKAAKKEKNKKKRKAVMRMSKADKERELTLHQSHLLLLLATQLKWSALCQSPVLRGLLLSITSGGSFDFYAEMKRHPLKYSLEMLVRWFNQHFHVLSVSDAAAHNDDSDDNGSGSNGQWSELVTEARLMQVFFDRRGRDYELAVLFTALCRALCLYCRHTCSLDALLVQQAKAFEASSAASPVSRSRKRSRTQSGTPRPAEQDQVENAEIASTQSFWVWTEVFDEKKRVWVHVDAIRKIVGHPREIEALRGKGVPFSYVVSITPSERLVDVTPRYAAKWSKSLRLRIADEWMGDALEMLNGEAMSKRRAVIGYAQQDEDKLLADEKVKLLAMIESEEMPASIEAFKKHHLYCLERHLGRFECIYPRKAVGIFKGQPVFLKKHIQVTRSAYQWLRLGREVKESEHDTPVKWHKKGGKQANGSNGGAAQDSDSDNDDTGGDGGSHAVNRDGARAMFGVWQTSAFMPPPVVNGVVPKNSYGNLEIWSAAHVPRHGVHVQLPRIEKVAQQLGVDFAPAVVGFEVKGDRNVPRFDGIVVAESALELLTDAHAHMQQSTIEKAIEKNQQLIAKRWERLVRRLLLGQRLEDDYGFVAKASESS
ncbi:Molybdenum cofactor biosynthesis protein a [Globisporangium polare]